MPKQRPTAMKEEMIYQFFLLKAHRSPTCYIKIPLLSIPFMGIVLVRIISDGTLPMAFPNNIPPPQKKALSFSRSLT